MLKRTTNTIKNELIGRFGASYDLSQVQYVNANTPLRLVCPTHGAFNVSPRCIGTSRGCKSCHFIDEARKIHHDKYDYSKVVYTKNNVEVCIVCPKHGEFWQTPNNHLQGNGCRDCWHERFTAAQTCSQDDFVNLAVKKHNGFYRYDNIAYVDSKTRINITCPIHGDFPQKPYKHLQGQGCPICHKSHLEGEIMKFLQDNKIDYIYQASRKDLFWLGLQSLDFYLPNHQIAIECQGKQHFFANCNFGSFKSKNQLDATVKRDKLKQKKCQENGVRMLYYSNLKIDYPYHVFEDKEDLLKEILK